MGETPKPPPKAATTDEPASKGAPPDVVVAGVPLATYAAVMAALAEPFPLEEVLAFEKIGADEWPDADLGWTERLVEDPGLLARYEKELAAAQDRLTRAVDPLDSDLSAWVAFVAAVGSAPAGVLAVHGLGPNDLARLRRAWDARIKADPQLEKRAVELQQRGPGRVPRVRAAAAKLGGSPKVADVAPASQAAPASVRPSTDVLDAVRLREHKRFTTQTGLAPSPRLPDPVRAPSPRAPVPRVPALPPIPALGRPAPVVRPVATATRPEEPPARPGPPAARDDEPTRTRMVVDIRTARELPFRLTPSRDYVDALQGPAREPGEGSDGLTRKIFVGSALTDPEPEPDSEPEEATVTIAALSVSVPVLPFDKDDDSQSSTVRITPGGPSLRRDDGDGPTRLMPTRGLRDAIPERRFEDPETVTGVDAILEPLPFIIDDEETPFSFGTVEVHGGMSVERHASLSVEFAVEPGNGPEILARYQMTAEEKDRVDALYKDLFAKDPMLRASWNRSFEIYRAWYLAHRS